MDSECEYVLMRGSSMWPTLREGELVKGRWRPTDSVSPGAIAGHWNVNQRLIIHRFLGVIRTSCDNNLLIRTGGDFSGRDRLHEAPQQILVIEKVLRGGRWIRPGNSLIYSVISIMIIRMSCYLKASSSIFPKRLCRILGRWWKAIGKISG
jgi:hypothetical protein